jgi:hypothetical protein
MTLPARMWELFPGERGFKVGQLCEELVAPIRDGCLAAIRAAMLQFHESKADSPGALKVEEHDPGARRERMCGAIGLQPAVSAGLTAS